MQHTQQLAKHFSELYFGDNWTSSDLKTILSDVTWREATATVYELNSILALTYHIHYYVSAITEVLEGKPLDAHDKYSFDHPTIQSEVEWTSFLETLWLEAKKFVSLIEQLPENQLDTIFSQEKYGTYYRNIQGVIEHSHYHLGQIAIIKKVLKTKNIN